MYCIILQVWSDIIFIDIYFLLFLEHPDVMVYEIKHVKSGVALTQFFNREELDSVAEEK